MSVRSSLLLCALAGMVCTAVQPADKAVEKPVDADLLEFLGSLDSEESGWHDYLERGAVKAPGKVPAKPPAKTPADAKQVKSK